MHLGFPRRHWLQHALGWAASGTVLAQEPETAPRLLAGIIPPLDDATRHPVGQRMQQLMQATGRLQAAEHMPWSRVQREAERLGGALVWPLGRLPQRERRWQWVAHLGDGEWGLTVRRAALPRLGEEAALRPLRVAVLATSAPSLLLRERGFGRLQELPYEHVGVRMLARGHVDAWACLREVAAHWLRQERVDLDALHPFQPLGRVSLYLAATPDVADAQLRPWRDAARSLGA